MNKGKQYLHPIDDDEYELIKLLVKGQFSKPIKERTRKEKNAVIKFWRNKSKFEVKEDGKLYFTGKEVVKCKIHSFLADIFFFSFFLFWSANYKFKCSGFI